MPCLVMPRSQQILDSDWLLSVDYCSEAAALQTDLPRCSCCLPFQMNVPAFLTVGKDGNNET